MIWKPLLNQVTKRHIENKIIHTHPLHLFGIIQDVDQYSSFLPLCSHSKILKYTTLPTDMANRRKRFEASLTVGLPGLFQETYVSAVTVLPSELMVDTVSISSKLFSSLKSRWQLSRTMDEAGNVDGNKCSVQFDVEISVVDPMIALTLDEILRQVAGRQVEAFSRRCVQVPYSDELVAMINQPQ